MASVDGCMAHGQIPVDGFGWLPWPQMSMPVGVGGNSFIKCICRPFKKVSFCFYFAFRPTHISHFSKGASNVRQHHFANIYHLHSNRVNLSDHLWIRVSAKC